MVRIKVKLESKGLLVIPKVVRESLGLVENQLMVLEVTDKSLRIETLDENIVEKWKKKAESEGLDVSNELVYGDKLHEKVL